MAAPDNAKTGETDGLNLQETLIDRHFFDIPDEIGTVLHAVPLLVTHPHKKAA